MPSPNANSMHFSTDNVPERDRVCYLRELFGSAIVKLDLEPLDRASFRQSCRLQVLPGLNIALGTTSGIVSRRTRALVADGNDDLIFTANLSGTSAISQLNADIELGANEALLLSSSDIGTQGFAETGNYLSLGIPRNALRERMADPEYALMRPIRGPNGPLRLLVDYIALTVSNHTPMDTNLQRPFAGHVHDLIALALGATRDGTKLSWGHGVRAARLAAMKADILANLRNEGMSVHDIARRHRVTARYVQMLFDDDGSTFSEYVVEQRLVQAHRMLSSPRFFDWTISAIAFEVGFGNLSYFNRTFRRRFGSTPSDVRNAVR